MSEREEHTVFEKEVKEFLEKNLPKQLARKIEFGESVSREELTLWTSILDKKGWVAPHWPLEFGGTDWNLQKDTSLMLFVGSTMHRHFLGLDLIWWAPPSSSTAVIGSEIIFCLGFDLVNYGSVRVIQSQEQALTWLV